MRADVQAKLDAVTVAQVQTALDDLTTIAAKAAYGANNLANLQDVQSDVKKMATDLKVLVRVVGALAQNETGLDQTPAN